jgi:hypothetical protein
LRAILAATLLLGLLSALQVFGWGAAIPFLGDWHGWAGVALTITAVLGALFQPNGMRRLVPRGFAFTVVIVFLIGLGFWLGWWTSAGLGYGGILAVHAVFALGVAILIEVHLSGWRETPDSADDQPQ